MNSTSASSREQGGPGLEDGVGGQGGEGGEHRGLASRERLDLQPVGHQHAGDHLARAHGGGHERAHLHLALVVGQGEEKTLEVGRIERRVAIEDEGEGVGGQGNPRVGDDEVQGTVEGAQVGGLALPVDVEVEDGVGLEGHPGHAHDAAQGLVELGRAVELPRAPALLGDLLQGVGRAVGGDGLVALVFQLIDAVAQLRELGQGFAEALLLALEGAVDGQHEGAVAEAGRERTLPGDERGRPPSRPPRRARPAPPPRGPGTRSPPRPPPPPGAP